MIAFAVGVGLGALSTLLSRQQPTPVEETNFLNFDPETTSQEMLAIGWSGYEHNDRNDSFVWCAAQHCTLLTTIHGQRDRRLSMRLWPFRFQGAPPQSMVVNLNGAAVGTVVLKDDPMMWEVKVEKSLWREGKNAFRFDFDYAQTPAGHIENNTDGRTLAMAFDWLEILPL